MSICHGNSPPYTYRLIRSTYSSPSYGKGPIVPPKVNMGNSDFFSAFLMVNSSCFVAVQPWQPHYDDVIMGAMASQIISLTIVYSTVYSGADQRKHQSSVSLAFVRGIHRGPVNSPHKWPVTRKMFPFYDVIMKWGFGQVDRKEIDEIAFRSNVFKIGHLFRLVSRGQLVLNSTNSICFPKTI